MKLSLLSPKSCKSRTRSNLGLVVWFDFVMKILSWNIKGANDPLRDVISERLLSRIVWIGLGSRRLNLGWLMVI